MEEGGETMALESKLQQSDWQAQSQLFSQADCKVEQL